MEETRKLGDDTKRTEPFDDVRTFYQSVSQNIDTVIFIVRKADNTIDYVFENTDRLWGIPSEKFYIDDPSETNELYLKIKEILRTERPKERKVWEVECFNKIFGQTMWLSAVCCPVRLNEEDRYLFSFSNLTEERLIRRALSEAANAASQASATKSRFLSNMSHDIRTPMNAIMGFATLAEASLGDDEKVHDYLKKILSAGNTLLGLMNNVLKMSLLESGKMVIEESENNLCELLSEIYTIVSEQMEEKHLDFHMDTSHISHPYVYCDSTHLKQILMNLLSNTLKFTPAGGKVFLSITQENGSLDGWGNYIIHVKDTGIGMSPGFLPRAFDSFEREVNSTVNKIPGAGLGLSMTKALVELMNGMIDVKSEQGKGTEFTVTFFFRLAQEFSAHDQPKALQEEEKDFTNTRILLVEDNELNREIATEILSEYGFQVETAENGQIALEKLSDSSPGYYDLILMDIQMPVMNGHEATRAIRRLEDSSLAGITIVAMTANAFQEDKQAAMDCGMNGFITKPIDVEELIGALGRLLS